MKKTVRPYLFIVVHLLIGLLILITVQSVPVPAGLHPALIILPVFVLLNLTYVRILKLQNPFKESWSPRKAYYFIGGAIAGVTVSLFPYLVAIVSGKIEFADLSIKPFSFFSLFITLLVVSWEELWFRSLVLEYCVRYISVVNLSITMGVLFVLVHLMNPEIDLAVSGPALFFAGALLTIFYLFYRNIWVPLGMHFGNNYFESLIETKTKNTLLFSPDGYLSALILSAIFFVFVYRTYKKELVRL